MVAEGVESGCTRTDLEVAFKKLALIHRAQGKLSLSWDAILEKFSPGIGEHIGSIDSIPSVEGYLKFCEVLFNILKCGNRKSNE